MIVGVLRVFLTVPWVDLKCGIVVFPDHSHLYFVMFPSFLHVFGMILQRLLAYAIVQVKKYRVTLTHT